MYGVVIFAKRKEQGKRTMKAELETLQDSIIFHKSALCI